MNSKPIPKCNSCFNTIFNRKDNAKYCLECAEDIRTIHATLNIKAYKLRKDFPKYNITIRIKVVKKEKYKKLT